MRLFIAIDLDDGARKAIADEQRRLKAAFDDSPSSLKWVRPEQMHLTLVFLGEVPETRVPAVVDNIGEPVAQAPFDLTFAGLGVFPPRGAPNVLWVGASSGEAESIALQRELADRVQRLGIVLERRPFHPHLTLARWKSSRGADRPRALEAVGDAVIATVRIDHATLYQSRLSSAGPAYTALARANLSASRRP
jgi:RNA 2',3'-cyclic 3'-phosphodiesterase